MNKSNSRSAETRSSGDKTKYKKKTLYCRLLGWEGASRMDSATIMLKARLLAKVQMARKPKEPRKIQVKTKTHAN